MGAPSHQNMEAPNHTIRSTAIPHTGRSTGPAVIGVTAAPGAAGTAITGTVTVGTAAGTAYIKAKHMVVWAGMEVGADMAAEAGMAAAADTFPGPGSILPLRAHISI